MLQGPAGALS